MSTNVNNDSIDDGNEDITNNSNSNLKRTRNMIEWRRSIVLRKLSQGWTQQQIAEHLKVSQPTISLDYQFLHCQAQDELENHISEIIPFHYKLVMEGFRDILLSASNIVQRSEDDRTKLSALSLMANIYDRIMATDLNGPTIAMAISKTKSIQLQKFFNENVPAELREEMERQRQKQQPLLDDDSNDMVDDIGDNDNDV